MADKPVTREEKYLAYLTGDYTGEISKPITRKEKYLYELCLKGIGGEISPEEIKNAVNEYLEKNPVKPGATTEQVQQIEQNKNDVHSLNGVLVNVDDCVSHDSIFTNTIIGDYYIRSDGTWGSSDSTKLFKFDVSEYVGKAINITNIFNNATLPMIAFYTRAFSNVGTAISINELINTVINSFGGESAVEIKVAVPNNAKTMVVATTNESYTVVKYKQYFKSNDLLEKINIMKEQAFSTNRLDLDNLTHGYLCNKNGVISANGIYCYTDFIDVKPGDKIEIFDGFITQNDYRIVTAYDYQRSVLSDMGSDVEQKTYTVPEGVYYVRVTMYENRMSDTTRININGRKPFEPYWSKELPIGVDTNKKAIDSMKNYPLTELPEYILNTLSYKPLGRLTKPYICFVSDDGNSAVNTYTIPLFTEKGVPCTFAIMKDSEIMQTEEQINCFVNALNNGMSVAQHGGYVWTKYDEDELMNFFNDEKEFFDSVGIDMKSAVCPMHYINKMICAVAGGRFGVMRSGYNGEGSTDNVVIHYEHYCNGARSNLYGLSSRSAVDGDITTHKQAIDYAVANNLLYILLFHENELTDEKKVLLEDIIDYAKSVNINFCTLEEIPYLT